MEVISLKEIINRSKQIKQLSRNYKISFHGNYKISFYDSCFFLFKLTKEYGLSLNYHKIIFTLTSIRNYCHNVNTKQWSIWLSSALIWCYSLVSFKFGNLSLWFERTKRGVFSIVVKLLKNSFFLRYFTEQSTNYCFEVAF